MSTATMTAPATSRAPANLMDQLAAAETTAPKKSAEIDAAIIVYRAAVQAMAEAGAAAKPAPAAEVKKLQNAMEVLGFTVDDFKDDVKAWSVWKQRQAVLADTERFVTENLAEVEALGKRIPELRQELFDAEERIRVFENRRLSVQELIRGLSGWELFHRRICMKDYSPDPRGRITGRFATSHLGLAVQFEDGSFAPDWSR